MKVRHSPAVTPHTDDTLPFLRVTPRSSRLGATCFIGLLGKITVFDHFVCNFRSNVKSAALIKKKVNRFNGL